MLALGGLGMREVLSFEKLRRRTVTVRRRTYAFLHQMISETRTPVWLVVALLSTWTAVGRAQIATDARVGVDSRLRMVTHSGQIQEALFVSESHDNLVVRYDCSPRCPELAAVPWADLERIEVFALQGHSWQRAFFHALVGGVAASALMLGASQVASSTRASGSDISGQLGVAVAAPYVVAVGAGAGFLHGWGQQDGWWERVWAAPAIPK
jgi:hypothetical protein